MFSLISSRFVTRDVLRGTLVWFLFSCVNVVVLYSITAMKTTLLHPGPAIFVYISATMNIEENVGDINTKLIYLQSQWKTFIYSTEPSEIELWIIILIVSLVLLCCCCPLLLLLAVSENFTHRNPLVPYLLCLCLARLKRFSHVSVVAVIGSA